ncbi:hypothetical protein M409DRAFT_70714 [Zasmidium cellare ATCC 36951]|uniref:FAD-binding domain-containing protein n=1 Tax=Zasmidium cellare ATCC 36951 TaxID=1080233 RepID=A0A6A6C2A5_ZASCE|nr:uncharacterized protein M409DRAFT_70714 [Zasmidium cellare ATCC 36951]KAF2159982.1 hypothetical protein M409DRAFT_70714 [Zasmidium cellare ATCC 36951]
MSAESNFSIAIVGGGIGGLFAALCLNHHCQGILISVDVYEQAAEYKEIGAGIGVGINGVRLAHKMGLAERLYALSGNPEGKASGPVFRRYDNGEELFRWPLPLKPGPIRLASCSRSALLDVLKSAVEERSAARLHTGKTCQKVEEYGDKIKISFADGTTAKANMLIACDGIHSAIRSQFVSDQATYSGQIAYRDIIPISSIPKWPYENYATMWLAKHSHFFVYPISQGRELNVIAFTNTPETEADKLAESWTTTCERADVQADFPDHEETVQMIIRLMAGKPSRWRINDREPLNQWHFMGGKVVLLGDSAHSMLPHMGAGSGQAMEDGWVLGRALCDHFTGTSELSDLQSVVNLYQSARLPRAQKAQAASRQVGNTYDCQTEDLIDLTFDECCPIIGERIAAAMKWVWDEDLDVCYENAREKMAPT